jgi:hypothetical protein
LKEDDSQNAPVTVFPEAGRAYIMLTKRACPWSVNSWL